MFDRSAGYTQQQKPIPVQMRLTDGQVVKGRLLPPRCPHMGAAGP